MNGPDPTGRLHSVNLNKNKLPQEALSQDENDAPSAVSSHGHTPKIPRHFSQAPIIPRLLTKVVSKPFSAIANSMKQLTRRFSSKEITSEINISSLKDINDKELKNLSAWLKQLSESVVITDYNDCLRLNDQVRSLRTKIAQLSTQTPNNQTFLLNIIAISKHLESIKHEMKGLQGAGISFDVEYKAAKNSIFTALENLSSLKTHSQHLLDQQNKQSQLTFPSQLDLPNDSEDRHFLTESLDTHTETHPEHEQPTITPAERNTIINDIPIAFEDVGVLAALAHPDHLLFVGSRGFAHLPPTHTSKSNGYRTSINEDIISYSEVISWFERLPGERDRLSSKGSPQVRLNIDRSSTHQIDEERKKTVHPSALHDVSEADDNENLLSNPSSTYSSATNKKEPPIRAGDELSKREQFLKTAPSQQGTTPNTSEETKNNKTYSSLSTRLLRHFNQSLPKEEQTKDARLKKWLIDQNPIGGLAQPAVLTNKGSNATSIDGISRSYHHDTSTMTTSDRDSDATSIDSITRKYRFHPSPDISSDRDSDATSIDSITRKYRFHPSLDIPSDRDSDATSIDSITRKYRFHPSPDISSDTGNALTPGDDITPATEITHRNDSTSDVIDKSAHSMSSSEREGSLIASSATEELPLHSSSNFQTDTENRVRSKIDNAIEIESDHNHKLDYPSSSIFPREEDYSNFDDLSLTSLLENRLGMIESYESEFQSILNPSIHKNLLHGDSLTKIESKLNSLNESPAATSKAEAIQQFSSIEAHSSSVSALIADAMLPTDTPERIQPSFDKPLSEAELQCLKFCTVEQLCAAVKETAKNWNKNTSQRREQLTRMFANSNPCLQHEIEHTLKDLWILDMPSRKYKKSAALIRKRHAQAQDAITHTYESTKDLKGNHPLWLGYLFYKGVVISIVNMNRGLFVAFENHTAEYKKMALHRACRNTNSDLRKRDIKASIDYLISGLLNYEKIPIIHSYSDLVEWAETCWNHETERIKIDHKLTMLIYNHYRSLLLKPTQDKDS